MQPTYFILSLFKGHPLIPQVWAIAKGNILTILSTEMEETVDYSRVPSVSVEGEITGMIITLSFSSRRYFNVIDCFCFDLFQLLRLIFFQRRLLHYCCYSAAWIRLFLTNLFSIISLSILFLSYSLSIDDVSDDVSCDGKSQVAMFRYSYSFHCSSYSIFRFICCHSLLQTSCS